MEGNYTNDDLRLELTKTRLKSLEQTSTTLERLAAQSIAQHVGLYNDCEDYDKISRLNGLPEFMLNKLLHELTNFKCFKQDGDWDQYLIHKKAFERLLCSQTKVIELNGFMTFCPKYLKTQELPRVRIDYFVVANSKRLSKYNDQVMKLIEKYAFNVQYLAINEKVMTDTPRCIINTNRFRFCQPGWYEVTSKEVCRSICKLKNLQKLQVYQLIYYTDLKKICTTLQKLQYVDVRIAFDQSIIFKPEIGRSFSLLKGFLFFNCYNESDFQHTMFFRLMGLCQRKFRYLDIYQNLDDSSVWDCNRMEASNTFPLPIASKHFRTTPMNRDLHNHWLQYYPNITHLTVMFTQYLQPEKTYESSRIESLLKFSNIESLTLEDLCSEEVAYRFLDKYGQNLRALSFKSCEFGQNKQRTACISLKLKLILDFCPKLEKLTLNSVHLLDNMDKIHHFAELREFIWIFPDREEKLFLSNILSAPQLQKFSIVCFENFVVGDLKRASSLIVNKKILRQLNTLLISVHQENSLENASTISAFNALTDMLKNASAFLPELVNFEVDLNCRYDLDDWKKIEKSFGNKYSYTPFCSYHSAAAFNYLGDPDFINFINAYKIQS